MSSEKGFDKAAAEVKQLKEQRRRREEENVGLSKKIDSMESQNEELRSEIRDLRETINRAKNISPWARPNFNNVRHLAKKACLDIVKAPGGWVVKMASRIGKKFKRLRDIWLILTQEEWHLHDDFFPHSESIPAPAPAPAPAPPSPIAPIVNRTAIEQNEIEVLRSEWRLFPSMRSAIEEQMRKFGIVLEAT